MSSPLKEPTQAKRVIVGACNVPAAGKHGSWSTYAFVFFFARAMQPSFILGCVFLMVGRGSGSEEKLAKDGGGKGSSKEISLAPH
jgi:hypothetical protein